MTAFIDYQAESYAKQHLLASGIISELKASQIFIWTIRAEPGELYIAIDRTQNPQADMTVVHRIIRDFLAPLDRHIDIQEISMVENCCYGVCHGCLCGDPEAKKIWIDPIP